MNEIDEARERYFVEFQRWPEDRMLGRKRNKSPTTMTDEIRREIMRLRAQGASMSGIAERLGIGRSSVRRVLVQAQED